MSKLDDLLGETLDNCLFDSGEVSWGLLTLSDNVLLLLVFGDQSLGQLSLLFGKDSLLFGVLGLVLDDVELLEGHSSFGFGNGNSLVKRHGLAVDVSTVFKLNTELFAFWVSVVSGLSFV